MPTRNSAPGHSTLIPGVSLGSARLGFRLRIEQISGGALLSAGALYQALARLNQGLTTAWGISDNNRRAKYYRITAAGRRRMGEETASWNRLVQAISMALSAKPQEA